MFPLDKAVVKPHNIIASPQIGAPWMQSMGGLLDRMTFLRRRLAQDCFFGNDMLLNFSSGLPFVALRGSDSLSRTAVHRGKSM